MRACFRRGAVAGATSVLLLTLTGCRQDMRDQERYEPLEAGAFFDDGVASRPLIENTIPRGHLRLDKHLYEGLSEEGLATEFPMAIDTAALERGRERYQIFCTPCHDSTGSGLGMIVRRGYKQPRSLHDPAVRAQPHGYYFQAITGGFGQMPSYARQIPVKDRWAIVAYIRALQLSQHVEAGLLNVEDRAALDAAEFDHGSHAKHGDEGTH